MNARIPESELILNPDGSVYHLSLRPQDIAETIITVGDPNRVHRISQYFDTVDFEMNKREFITHTGTLNNKRITVMSTGMGTDNVEIALTELDALVNVDLKERVVKSKKRKLKIIRIGTSGSLQSDIPLGSHLISQYAFGLDTLMQFYNLKSTPDEQELANTLQEAIGLPFTPYCVKGSESLIAQLGEDMMKGNTLTAPGFYAPQGRIVRLGLKLPKLIEQLNYFHHNDQWLTNFEMETAGYYAMGRLLGHEVVSVNAIIANRITNKFSKNPDKVVDSLIKKVLSRL
ncbi:nucleoside phosphorylase [Cytophagales bacterium LB-30]|uniref:Uridine phosphorylase n=1 Tax=Shiella aurantiaca TaxID=3058365 RepID=A0ABT8F1F2_9BACT|nr:nucleoside phosphorylase [Shiella aurantiaca]MDN4164277.1 nucleoside phosphorylase [Shiella aurantiaca]